MASYDSDPWVTAAGGLAVLGIELLSAAISLVFLLTTTVVVPLVIFLLLGLVRLQESLLTATLPRLTQAAGSDLNAASPVLRVAATIALYAFVASPLVCTSVLLALHFTLLMYSVGGGLLIGLAMAIVAQLLERDSSDDALARLRFW